MAKKKAATKRKSIGPEWQDHRGRFTEGNPGGGRPKGSLSLVTILKRELSKGKDSRAIKVVRKLIEQAEAGDVVAAKALLEHIDGKPLQRLLADVTTHEPTIIVRKEKQE